jgi:RimJ/RimL family protein N-acetyltransferase
MKLGSLSAGYSSEEGCRNETQQQCARSFAERQTYERSFDLRSKIVQHTIHAEGFGVRLRPVRMDDAAFIVWLRNLDHAKGRVGDSALTEVSQQAWLVTYFDRPGDYYFIIETLDRLPVGAYGIYDVRGDSAESGRWVIRPDAPAAIPSAMVAFDIAFGTLGLSELRVRTVSTNRNVLSLNRKFGFQQVLVEPGAQIIGGESVDMVHFLLPATDWPKVRERLLPLANLAEKQTLQWAQGQSQA